MNELEALAEKERQEKIQQEQQEQQLKEQLLDMEQHSVTTDAAQRTAYKEKALTREKQYEASLTGEMNAQAQHAEVNAGPPEGVQPQAAPAAEESRKERRERIKREKKTAADIKDVVESTKLSISPEMDQQIHAHGYDDRAVGSFCETFHVDKYGHPATPRDEEILRRNQTFVAEYAAGSATQHAQWLSVMTNKVLTMELKPHMLDDENYIMENAAVLKKQSQQLTYFENVMKNNRDYFNALSPEIRDKINSKINLMNFFGAALTSATRANSVRFDTAQFTGNEKDEEESRREQRENYHDFRSQFQTDCAAYNLEQERIGLHPPVDRAQEKAFYLEKYGAYFENGAGDYQYDELKRVRDCIVKNPERYQENKEVIDHFYQEFYRSLEAAGKAATDVRDYIELGARHADDKDADGQMYHQLAEKRCDEKGREVELLSEFSANIEDVLLATLNGEAMPEVAQKMLADYYEEKRVAHWTAYADQQRAGGASQPAQT